MNDKELRKQLLNQRRIPWVNRVRLTAMNPNMVRPAEGRRVGKVIGFAAMFKRRDVVDFEETSFSTFLATPTVTM